MKTIEKMTFEELVDWAAGHILKQLIKGNFRDAVYTVCDYVVRWDRENKHK